MTPFEVRISDKDVADSAVGWGSAQALPGIAC
jgi:hypothetical protein